MIMSLFGLAYLKRFSQFPGNCVVATSCRPNLDRCHPECLPRVLVSRFANNRLASTMAAETSSSDLVVDHDVEKRMFFINLAGETEKAVLEYEIVGHDAVNLYHTGVPVSQRGKGIAKVLAKAALDHFVFHGTNMQLTCTYLKKYFCENPLPQYKARVMDVSRGCTS